MSVKRKWLTRITVSIITFSMLLTVAGCGEDDDTASVSAEKIVIEYAGGDTKYMASEMAEKYEQDHPNIDVVIHDNHHEYMGNEYMQQMAATDTMPDIFNLENPDYPIKNKWVVDLKPYLDKEENLEIPQNIIDYGTYDGKTVMIPNGVFLNGVMVNKDLLLANNLEVPKYTWTTDEFVEIAKKTTKKGSTIGLNDSLPIMKHYPAQKNPELGWAAFNWETKHFQFTPEWVEAAEMSKELFDAHATAFEQLDQLASAGAAEGAAAATDLETQTKALCNELVGEENVGAAWNKGKVAMMTDFTWSMKFDDAVANPDYTGFAWDFYPFPVAEAGQISRPGMAPDSWGISTSCEHPAEAYDVLKYMTFSTEGEADRLEIQKNYDQAAAKLKYPEWDEQDLPVSILDTAMPATTNQQVLDNWAAYIQVPAGVEYMMGNLDTGYVDSYKVVPGYDAAYEKGAQQAFREQVLYGTAAPADVAKDLETNANAIVDEAFAAMVSTESSSTSESSAASE